MCIVADISRWTLCKLIIKTPSVEVDRTIWKTSKYCVLPVTPVKEVTRTRSTENKQVSLQY